ncbi:hypothetical protein A5633_01715 [Mycolicibacterium elephantis]|nr:membrane protein [Mycolicibacterium elephantis]OBA73887.1 hypothetical protein A5633_01715 [Mycolicibacterium elephantis]OBB16812.1 hypothetical protein A5762_25210 [Mycolicibacterium elephantis]OBE95864.1 hypothetical protein A5776_20090 [Mycolicibacterium elephantis]
MGMTDSPHRGGEEQAGWRDGSVPSQPPSAGYPGYADPAYASQTGYGPSYQTPAPTQQMPPYPPYGYDPYATGQYGQQYPPGQSPQEPPQEEPEAPRWLWVLAGVAVVTVVGLVVALVIVNVNRSRQETVVAPPAMQEPRFTTPTPTTTSPRPTIPVVPAPTVPRTPPTTTVPSPSPGVTETVVYNVTGTGRAINITYVDSGGLLQTEFNVLLPWSKQVELSEPAEGSASISIINVGREVSCSITVNGVMVQQRTGAGLTICTALG